MKPGTGHHGDQGLSVLRDARRLGRMGTGNPEILLVDHANCEKRPPPPPST